MKLEENYEGINIIIYEPESQFNDINLKVIENI